MGVLKAGTEQIWALELCRGSPRRFRSQRRRLCSLARDWDQAAEGAQEWGLPARRAQPCSEGGHREHLGTPFGAVYGRFPSADWPRECPAGASKARPQRTRIS